ncbi:hypothetical protein PG996_000205 [Apiospora saccharicola]|uniref:Uncharacterized protein n=1 Tax=Apiospora saccharicola TaxID=335842 RepID=A0ABR1WGY4_9PEZI
MATTQHLGYSWWVPRDPSPMGNVTDDPDTTTSIRPMAKLPTIANLKDLLRTEIIKDILGDELAAFRLCRLESLSSNLAASSARATMHSYCVSYTENYKNPKQGLRLNECRVEEPEPESDTATWPGWLTLAKHPASSRHAYAGGAGMGGLEVHERVEPVSAFTGSTGLAYPWGKYHSR